MAEVRLEDFEIPKEERAHMLMPMRFDIRKILALNDKDFAFFNLLGMQEYRDGDGWWKNGKTPKCFECNQPVLGPEQLARYHGTTYDKSCFRTFWDRDGIREEQQTIFKTYFERIANLSVLIV